MTGFRGAHTDQHRKGGFCRRQLCSPDTDWGLGDWAVWFRRRELEAETWLLAAGSWDCDWGHSNRLWGSFYMLVHVDQQSTVATLCIDKSVWPNETSSASSESWSGHPTLWEQLSCGWNNLSRRSFCAASWTQSKIQDLFPRLPLFFKSSILRLMLFDIAFCQLAWVRKHLWRCQNDARGPRCNSMLHHRDIYMENPYGILTMPVCTQLRDWLSDTEQGFRLAQTGLQLQAGTGWFLPSPSHSMDKLPHMTYFLVWGRGMQAPITRLHFISHAVHGSSWSAKSNTCGGQVCCAALYRGAWASGGRSWYREYI